MSDTFLSADPVSSREEIIQFLYDRLRLVRRGLRVKVDYDDQFNFGINCSLTNEELFLQDLLDMIERS